MARDENCKHPGCNCRASEDSDYCSALCEAAGDEVTEVLCDCGHPGCGAA